MTTVTLVIVALMFVIIYEKWGWGYFIRIASGIQVPNFVSVFSWNLIMRTTIIFYTRCSV